MNHAAQAHALGLTPATLRTLKYWAPGPYADHVHTHTPDRVLDVAYDGLALALDLGLLWHKPMADRYVLTAHGQELIERARELAA